MENNSNGGQDSGIAKLNENLNKLIAQIETLNKPKNNESSGSKQTRAEKISSLNDSIKEKKTKGEGTAEDEVQLVKAKADERLAEVRKGGIRELKIKKDTAKQLRDLETEGTDAWNDKQKEMLDANKGYYDALAEEVGKYADAAGKMMDGVKAFAKADAEEQTRIAEDTNAKEKEELKNKYEQGLISKKEYDKEVKASDKRLADEKGKIAAEQARKEKAAAITKIIIETGVAIMKAWSAGPFAAPFLIGTIAATSAMQIAAIAKTPVPKARRGGIIAGGSHENGGVLIEAEGGEAILSRAAMSAFPGVAKLMNAAALSGGITDGGYAARSMAAGSSEFNSRRAAPASQGIDYERLSSMMTEKMSQAKIYVSVTDINDGQRNYARITDLARI